MHVKSAPVTFKHPSYIICVRKRDYPIPIINDVWYTCIIPGYRNCARTRGTLTNKKKNEHVSELRLQLWSFRHTFAGRVYTKRNIIKI